MITIVLVYDVKRRVRGKQGDACGTFMPTNPSRLLSARVDAIRGGRLSQRWVQAIAKVQLDGEFESLQPTLKAPVTYFADWNGDLEALEEGSDYPQAARLPANRPQDGQNQVGLCLEAHQKESARCLLWLGGFRVYCLLQIR